MSKVDFVLNSFKHARPIWSDVECRLSSFDKRVIITGKLSSKDRESKEIARIKLPEKFESLSEFEINPWQYF